MLCCANCFGDPGLAASVIEVRAQGVGRCPVCSSAEQALVEALMLRDNFEFVASIYQLDDAGEPLLHWMKTDWHLLKHPHIADDKATELLVEILQDKEVATRKLKPLPEYAVDTAASWETLRSELMLKNRFFPSAGFDLPRLADLLSSLAQDGDAHNKVWYRARISHDGRAFLADDLLAPPHRLASHGRANPVGIPYLYLGSSPESAVAEVRPYPAEKVFVAEFSIKQPLRLIDLREPRPLLSPFLFEEIGEVGRLRGEIALLERLGRELTTPVAPSSAAIDYVPSQYLCEFIKNNSFDGVLYASTVGTGLNMALFDPDAASIGRVVEYAIDSVAVKMHATAQAAA